MTISIPTANACPLIVNIPHTSVTLPADVPFFLSPEALNREAHMAADLYTDCMLRPQRGLIPVIAPVSRLVTDTERYEDDTQEVAAASGHGVIYTRTIAGTPLRPEPTAEERLSLLQRYYHPHHHALTDAAARSLELFGRALILDLHSYPSRFAMAGMREGAHPEICIGTVSDHTPVALKELVADCCRAFRLTCAFDTPFSGAILPTTFADDTRVSTFMLEIRRDTYMNERTFQRHAGWKRIQEFVNTVGEQALRLRS